MSTTSTDVFDLPENLTHKASTAVLGEDPAHFAAIADVMERQVALLTERLDQTRRTQEVSGQQALQRDQEIHRLSADLRVLQRFGLDVCLGRVVPQDGEPMWIGRIGLSDDDGQRLLVDWRAPAAEPFFAATHSDPMGLVSRRRYRWSERRITDFWDEAFTRDALESSAALDDQSAFIASLGASRSGQMQDVLGTIQSDQDAIIRADSRGALVVDGGPGTGKTVVALHRAAYLLYSDRRLGDHHGGVLLVGPHRPYLSYVADVLPGLGEDGVRTCTVADLLPEGASAGPEVDPRVAELKSSARMVEAIEPAVRLYEEPPTEPTLVETDWADVTIDAEDWAEAFAAPEPGLPHNEAREQVHEALVEIVLDRLDGEDDVAPDLLRRMLRADEDLNATLNRAWPLISPTDLVGDLWSVPAYLRMCAPWLSVDEVRMMQRREPHAWTVSDLPLLDAARRRLGDPDATRRRRRREAAVAAEREQMAEVVDHLIASDDSEMRVMSMLRGEDLGSALVDEAGLPTHDPDLLAGPFAHVIVDEAQELTDAEWQMLIARCPSRSLTVVGDRAQARHGFTESWAERLERVGLERHELASLSVNYRTPREVMAEAEPVIREVLADANVPTSVRESGIPVRHGSTDELDTVLTQWLDTNPEGIACVIGDPTVEDGARIRSLAPVHAKGLEFDLVVLVDPRSWGGGVEGAVDRYVAMTRATRELVILTSG